MDVFILPVKNFTGKTNPALILPVKLNFTGEIILALILPVKLSFTGKINPTLILPVKPNVILAVKLQFYR